MRRARPSSLRRWPPLPPSPAARLSRQFAGAAQQPATRRSSRSRATSRSPSRPTPWSTTATRASSPPPAMSRPGRTTTCCAPTGHLRPQHQRRRRDRPRRAGRAGRAGAVRRLRRAHPGHARRRAARHARAAGRERQAGRQRRPPHRRPDQRAVARGLFHLQSLREGPERAAALAAPRAHRDQDLENKRIEYRDALLDIYGVPVMYLPYFSHADPSVKRASGFLVPSIGSSEPSRRLHDRAVLLGDRPAIGRDLHADDRDQGRAATSTRSTAAASTTAR